MKYPSVFRTSLFLIVLAAGVVQEPAFSGEGAGGKEGGGGNEVGLEVQSSAVAAIQEIRDLHSVDFSDLDIEALRALAKSARFLERRNTLVVNYEGKPQEVIARNFPSEGLIEINRWRWQGLSDVSVKKALALHEVLSLKKLESTGSYSYSSLYLAAQRPASFHPVDTLSEFPALPNEVIALDTRQPLSSLEVSGAILKCSVPEASGREALAWSLGGQIYTDVYGAIPNISWISSLSFSSDTFLMTGDVRTTILAWWGTKIGPELHFSWPFTGYRSLTTFSVKFTPPGGRETLLNLSGTLPFIEYDVATTPNTEFDSWGNPIGKDFHMATNLRLVRPVGQPQMLHLVNASGRPAPANMVIDTDAYTNCLKSELGANRR